MGHLAWANWGEKRYRCSEDNVMTWVIREEAGIQWRKRSRTLRAWPGNYLSSTLSTWPCQLRCAYFRLSFPPGIPQPDFTKLLQSAEAGANPHKAVYLQCSTEWHMLLHPSLNHMFVRSWPDLGSRFELGLIGAPWLVGWANWGNVRLINM